jgi:hypothetical protein
VICESAHPSCEELNITGHATKPPGNPIAASSSPDHETPDVEHVLERAERFWVVLKTAPRGAEAERPIEVSRQD